LVILWDWKAYSFILIVSGCAFTQIYLYLPQATLTIYQKAAHYLGIKIFNNLPLEIKNVADNPTKFKTAQKLFLYIGRVP
jgi:hypothetical protein